VYQDDLSSWIVCASMHLFLLLNETRATHDLKKENLGSGLLSRLYTPQWNGVSERRNRTLLDMVRSMMSQTDLLLSFWGYAFETIVFMLNRGPLSLLRGHHMRYRLGSIPDCLSSKFEDVRLMSNI
jgi:hypothetical protein